MKYTFSREEMHYLLKGVHVSLFGKPKLSQGKSEKIRQRLIDKELLDHRGLPVLELAKTLEPLLDADDELSCPFPFDDINTIRLRASLFVKEGKVTAACMEGVFKVSFVLETIEGEEQLENAVLQYLDLHKVKKHEEVFSLRFSADEFEALGEASLQGDFTTIKEAACKYYIQESTLAEALQEVLVDTHAQAKTLLASRGYDKPGTLILKIRTDLGLVMRWIMGIPALSKESLVYLERIPKTKLMDFLIDYKGY